MTQETMINLLLSIRAQVDAIIEAVTAGSGLLPNKGQDECQHPQEQRQNISVLGSNIDRWRCKLCGYMEEKEYKKID